MNVVGWFSELARGFFPKNSPRIHVYGCVYPDFPREGSGLEGLGNNIFLSRPDVRSWLEWGHKSTSLAFCKV